MLSDKEFRFTVSLSLENFENKEIATAMMDSSKKKEVRDTRKEYGYHPIKGTSFVETDVTPLELLNHLLSGKVFCHCFNTKGRKDVEHSFGSSEKKYDNFRQAWCIGVDIDKTRYTISQFIDKLSLKPTFWYSSYSHMTWNKKKKYGGPRFRLIYVFDQPIEDIYWFKFISHHLLELIKRDTNEDVLDKCSESAAQYFNGTNIEKLNGVEYGCTDILYEKEDVIGNITPFSDEFISYLEHFCYYEDRKEEHKSRIKSLLERLTDNEYTYISRIGGFQRKIRYFDDPIELIDDFEFEIPEDYLTQDMEILLRFWDNTSIEDFKRIGIWNVYRKKYRYIYRLEKKDWSKGYQIVDDDYFSLPFYYHKRMDGECRRKTLYQRCCLRRYMYPNISKNELIVNYIKDVIKFFDDPKKDITSEVIIKNIGACLSQTIDDIELKYGKLIEHYRNITHPKRNIIRKDKTKMTKEFTFNIIDDYYNDCFSITENYEVMKLVLPFPISLNYLYQYTKTRGIKNDMGKISDDVLYGLIHADLSGDKNLILIRDMGFKCKKDRLYRLLKKKRNDISLHMESVVTFGDEDRINGVDSSSSNDSLIKEVHGVNEKDDSSINQPKTTINVEIKKGEMKNIEGSYNDYSLSTSSVVTFGDEDRINGVDFSSSNNSLIKEVHGVNVNEESQNSPPRTTINVEIKKGEITDIKVKQDKVEKAISTDDIKVLRFLKEDEGKWGEDWENEYNEAYYIQKEIYSRMSGEEVLDDILSWCKDFMG